MANDTYFALSNKSKDNNTKRKKNNLLIPLAFVLIIVPLIVHEYIFTPQIAKEAWFPEANELSDYFMYYKEIALMGIGFLLIVILLYKQFTAKQKPFLELTLWQLPLAIYAMFAVVSSLLSEYSSISWNGSYEQFETTLILCTYCILTFYSYYVIKSSQDVKFIVQYLYVGIGLITLIGLLQVLGLDPITSTVGKYLISADKSKEAIDSIILAFEKNRVYLTFLNPNYVGVYASLLFPITLGLAILLKDKKMKIISLILSILLVVSVFGAQSKTALFILAGTVLLVVIILRRNIFTNKKSIIAMALSSVVIVTSFFVINAMQNNTYIKNIKNAFQGSDETKNLQSITTKANYVEIVYKNQLLKLKCELDSEGKIDLGITDNNDNVYKFSYDESSMTFTMVDEAFKTIRVQPVFLNKDNVFGCTLTIDDFSWSIKSKTATEGYAYMNAFGKFDQLVTPASYGFKNYQSLFSGRGYIWSRSLPLIKDNIVIGQGPNTYVYAFPQQDYVGKYNNNLTSQVITKPHNLYLQMTIETGLISAIAFIILCLIYLAQWIRIYIRLEYKTITEQVGLLVGISVIAYMVSGVLNDSNIGIAPIFWILLGVGFACNRQVKLEKKRNDEIAEN